MSSCLLKSILAKGGGGASNSSIISYLYCYSSTETIVGITLFTGHRNLAKIYIYEFLYTFSREGSPKFKIY